MNYFVPCKNKRLLSSPIIRDEIKNLKPFHGKKVLVYISKQNNNILNILKTINEEFIVYGFNVNKKDKNLIFRKFEESNKNWFKDLESCKAIISTAGFNLIAEAVYLKKPFLAIPLRRHYEQIFNAKVLDELNYGKFLQKPSKKEIESFLKNLNMYNKKLKNQKFQFPQATILLEENLEKFYGKKQNLLCPFKLFRIFL
jgi:uncharacterized protein (TIGR00661 family)